MGSAASNQNRVSSGGLVKDGNDNSHRSTNGSRPWSSLSAKPKLENNDIGHKKETSPLKTDVVPLPKKDFEGKEETKVISIVNDEQKTLRELEIQLAKSESQNLDLLEQLNGLKQANLPLKPRAVLPPLEENSSLQETAFAKDQYIVKLEKDVQAAQKELACVRQKLKKRVRALTNQLHEVRQEASINQMELKAEISHQKEEIEKLKGSKDICSEGPARTNQEMKSKHSKIIVELSSQLSEQSEHITSLEAHLAVKDQKIQELEGIVKNLQTKAFDPPSLSSDRLPSGRGKRSYTNSADKTLTKQPCETTSQDGCGVTPTFHSHHVSPILERQSTALSDSDSDWELDAIPSKIHSAPAGTRVKSAVSISSIASKKNGAIDMQGNDDTFLNTTTTSKTQDENNASSSFGRVKVYKKSALKSHLERKKNANQISALIGPSLAFAAKPKEFPSDTSCEPTPRCADHPQLQGFQNPHIVNSVSH